MNLVKRARAILRWNAYLVYGDVVQGIPEALRWLFFLGGNQALREDKGIRQHVVPEWRRVYAEAAQPFEVLFDSVKLRYLSLFSSWMDIQILEIGISFSLS